MRQQQVPGETVCWRCRPNSACHECARCENSDGRERIFSTVSPHRQAKYGAGSVHVYNFNTEAGLLEGIRRTGEAFGKGL